MANHLGDFFRAKRTEKGLSLGEMARLLGYRNVNKGSRRILALEGGDYREALLLKLMEILDIDPETVQELMDRDRREYVEAWELWADERVPIQLVVRWMPAVYARANLPETVQTPDGAITYGQELARRIDKKVFVVLSRRETVNIDEDGVISCRIQATPDQEAAPFMHIRRKRFLFNFEQLDKPEEERRS